MFVAFRYGLTVMTQHQVVGYIRSSNVAEIDLRKSLSEAISLPMVPFL